MPAFRTPRSPSAADPFRGGRDAALALLLLVLTGCATLANGTRQQLLVTSTPTGAAVTVDGASAGVTPLTVSLKRKQDHLIGVRLDGYAPASQSVIGSASTTFWVGNGVLLLAGGLGFWTGLVDLLDGAAYSLEPDPLGVSLVSLSDLREPAPASPASLPPGRYRTIAVADLDAQGVSASDAAVVADMLRNRLVNVGGYQVVEKRNMDKVLAEQAFQQTGCTSQECAVKLGKLLNVQAIAVGSFGKLLDRYVVSVRLVDVQSGQVAWSDEAKGDTLDELETGLTDLARRAAGR